MVKKSAIVSILIFVMLSLGVTAYPYEDTQIYIGKEAGYYDGVAANLLGQSLGLVSEERAATTKIGDLNIYGDAFRIWKKGDVLEASEYIKDVVKQIDGNDLSLLEDGVFSTKKGDHKYTQTLVLPPYGYNALAYARGNPWDDEDIPKSYAIFNTSYFYDYKLDFMDVADSTIEDGKLVDFEHSTISMLGKDFEIVEAKMNSVFELVLMSGAIKETMREGQKEDFVVDGKVHEVEVVAIQDVSPKSVKFKIDGVMLNKLPEGGSDIVGDLRISVSEIIPNEAGDVEMDLVEFYLGSYKVVLKDDDITSDGNSYRMKVNDDSVDYVEVEITGRNESGVIKLEQIRIKWQPDDKYYVVRESYMSDILEDQNVLFGDLDFYYYGSNPNNEVETIEFVPSGSKEYKLRFENIDDELLEIPLFYDDSGSFNRYGDSSHQLVANESFEIAENDYFLVTSDGSELGTKADGLTKLFKYKGQSVSERNIRLQDMGTGELLEIPYTGNTAYIHMAGEDIWVNITDNSTNDSNITVDLDNDGDISNSIPMLVTKYGSVIMLTGYDRFEFVSKECEEGFARSTWATYGVTKAHDYLQVIVGDDNGEIDVTNMNRCLSYNHDEVIAAIGAANDVSLRYGQCYPYFTSTLQYMFQRGEEDVYEGATAFGQFIEWYKESNNPDSVYIASPEIMDEALMFMIERGTEFELIEDDESDEDAAGLRSKNIILDTDESTAVDVVSIGGPCVNRKTAEIMGLDFPTCGYGVGVDEGFVKEYDYNDGKALVVYGWDAIDTYKAIQMLMKGLDIGDGVIIKGEDVRDFEGFAAVTTTTMPVVTTTTLSKVSCPGGSEAHSSYQTRSRKFGLSEDHITQVDIKMDGLEGDLHLIADEEFKAQFGVDWLDFTIHIVSGKDCSGKEVQSIIDRQTDGEQEMTYKVKVPSPGCYCIVMEDSDLVLDSAGIGLIPDGIFEMKFSTS